MNDRITIEQARVLVRRQYQHTVAPEPQLQLAQDARDQLYAFLDQCESDERARAVQLATQHAALTCAATICGREDCGKRRSEHWGGEFCHRTGVDGSLQQKFLDPGIAGDHCGGGNECGRLGCPECQQ